MSYSLKCQRNGVGMSSFRERFGNLTVEQAKSLNEAAKWYCEHEITTETKKN